MLRQGDFLIDDFFSKLEIHMVRNLKNKKSKTLLTKVTLRARHHIICN